MRKALFFDVDGTLMNAEHRIPDSALDALRRSRAAGNYIFVNSGRTSGLLKRLMAELPADGFLCGCGTELFFRGERIYSYTVSEEEKRRLKTLQARFGIACLLEGRDGTHFQVPESVYRQNPGLRERAERELGFVEAEGGLAAGDYDDAYPISKFCFFGAESSDIPGVYACLAGKFDIIDRGGFFYEAVPCGHGKGAAVDRMLRHLGIEREDAFAFGDSMNDLDMFLHAGHTIAMREHSAGLAPYTEYVTDSVDADGIRKAMRHFHLV